MLLDNPWGAGQVVAHRGSRVLWPENTMVAFGNAIDHGAHHLETDLHLTADGTIVCFHDDTVERTTDGLGPVSAMTLREVRGLDAGYNHRVDGDFPFRGRGIRVPTLGEVLATFPEIGVVVDLKQDGLAAPLVEVLNKMNAWERVIIGSFSELRLADMRSASSGRAQLSGGPSTVQRWWLATRVGRSGPSGPVALQVPTSYLGLRIVDQRFVDGAHEAGVAIHVWTANQVSHLDWLRSIGVDAVITDRPDLVRSLV